MVEDSNLRTARPSPYRESDRMQPDYRGRRMDLGTLKALLDSNKVAALAAMQSSKLSSERDDALMYYVGDMSKDMPAPDGRSQAVSSDVQDTIEGLMPALMEIFVGSEEVVQFNPTGPEDVAAAEQETDYVNHVIMSENPGFITLYSFIKDALLSKNGIVKVWWEEEAQEVKETYYDLTDDEFAILVEDPEVEITKHTVRQGAENTPPAPAGVGPQSAQPGAPANPPQSAPAMPEGFRVPQGYSLPPQEPETGLHDVEVVHRKNYGRVKIAPVAPEEFGIEKTARTLRQGFVGGCNYCFHRVIRSQDELISMGFDPDQIRSLPTYMAVTNIEEINRDTVAEHQNVGEDMNPASRRIEVVEHYTRMDYEGDGKARLYKVTTGSEQGQILFKEIEDEDGNFISEPDIEEFDEMPFAAMTPVIVTHRFFGRSMADLTMEIQRIKTALLRAMLDNAYLAVNPRVVVSETGASDSTLDDLLISRPGGIVRAKTTDAVEWQEVPSVGNYVLPLLEYADQMREVRSGVQRQGQQITSDALQNQSATAANHLFTAIQARQRLIARILAETGIKDLCILVHGLIRKHGQVPQTVRLRNQWVTIDPRDWKKRDDMIVNVGLGTGGKAEQLATAQIIIAMQEKALMGGLTNIVTPSNLYNSAKLLTHAAGHKDVDAFFSDPKTQPPPQPPPNPDVMKAQVEQMKMQGQQQLAQQKMQSDVALEQARFQADSALEQQKFEHQKQLDMLEMGMKQREHENKIQLETHKANTQAISAQHSMALEEKKAQTAAQPKTTVAVKHGADQLTGPLTDAIKQFGEHLSKSHEAQMDSHKQLSETLLKHVNAKKRIVRGKDGRASHLEPITE